jgi:hypothetical protein
VAVPNFGSVVKEKNRDKEENSCHPTDGKCTPLDLAKKYQPGDNIHNRKKICLPQAFDIEE